MDHFELVSEYKPTASGDRAAGSRFQGGKPV